MISANVLRGARRVVRLPAVQRLQVLEERRFVFAGEFAQRRLRFADALDDLVVHVRDVHHVRDLEAFEFEVAPDEVAEDERAPVADVREVIDRRPAAIHADLLAGRIERDELLHRARQCVEQFQTHSCGSRVSEADGKQKGKTWSDDRFGFARSKRLQCPRPSADPAMKADRRSARRLQPQWKLLAGRVIRMLSRAVAGLLVSGWQTGVG